MTWLKYKGKLINLAHITAIQVEGKEVEFCGEKYESILFNSEEAAQAYFEHVAEMLEAKSDRSANPTFTETEGDAVELAFEAASRFGRYKEKEAMAWIRDKSKLVAAAVQRIGFLEICDSAQPDVIRGQLRAIFAAEKSRAIDTGVVVDSATQLDDGVNKRLLDFVAGFKIGGRK
jgi:hypothetical protein